MITAPSPMLESSKLVKYATTDPPVVFTGRQVIYLDGKLLDAAPRLAICENLSDQRMHLLLCDDDWNVIAASTGDSLVEVEEMAERWYRGIEDKWIKSPYGEEEFRKYAGDQREELRCSFCGRWDWEYGQAFSVQGSNICDVCVRSFFEKLSG